MLKRQIPLGVVIALTFVGVTLPLPAAHAADLDYNYGEPPPETKVEFGSGWYVRGDIGATFLPTMNIATPSLPTAPNQNPPPAPAVALGSGHDVGYVASVAGGYQFNHWFRTDLMFDYHQPIAQTSNSGNGNVFCTTGVSYPYQVGTNYGPPNYANGGCTGNYQSKISSYDVLVNGYIDIGTWHSMTPYVGAGVGVGFGHYQSSATYVQANGSPYHITYTDPQFNATFAPNFDRQSSGTYYNFAFAAMAGVAIDVYDHTKLDIGYRYLHLGTITALNGSLQEQEVRVGVRYMIDN